jgi:hypothetical protein
MPTATPTPRLAITIRRACARNGRTALPTGPGGLPERGPERCQADCCCSAAIIALAWDWSFSFGWLWSAMIPQ